VSKFVLGEHESVEVLADAIYAAQVDKRGRSYGGNFADVELPADEVAFIFKFLLTYLEFLIVLCILCQHIPVILFVHATFAVSIYTRPCNYCFGLEFHLFLSTNLS
jgi:hypothetical protein